MAKKPDHPFAPLAALRSSLPTRAIHGSASTGEKRAARPKETKRLRPPTAQEKSDSERALRDAFAGVKPLSDRERGRVGRGPSDVDPKPAVPRAKPPDLRYEDIAAHQRLAALVAGGVRFEETRDEDGRVRVQRVGEDRSVLRALVRGELPVDGELDLHGMLAADAEAAVVRFVRRHARDGARAVRIVHGKGLHSAGGRGVLGDVVLRALMEGGAAPVVRAIATPDEDEGGLGAVIVALGGAR